MLCVCKSGQNNAITCVLNEASKWGHRVIENSRHANVTEIKMLFLCGLNMPTLCLHFHKVKTDLSIIEFDLIPIQTTDTINHMMVLSKVCTSECLNDVFVLDSEYDERNHKIKIRMLYTFANSIKLC